MDFQGAPTGKEPGATSWIHARERRRPTRRTETGDLLGLLPGDRHRARKGIQQRAHVCNAIMVDAVEDELGFAPRDLIPGNWSEFGENFPVRFGVR